MNAAIIELALANAAFVGSHFALSHPLRGPLIKWLGERGFMLAYTIIGFATLGWVAHAFVKAPAADLPGSGTAGWLIASALAVPAMVLLAGSFIGNPALPTPFAARQARSAPGGVFAITRHPMMWAIALWALAHIALFWSIRTSITAFAMGLLALLGAHLQDRKKRRVMGADWSLWESRTHFWPRWSKFGKAGWLPLTAGLAFFALLTWLHWPIGAIKAGLWRWI